MVKAVDKSDQYRYERKFLIPELTKYQIESMVKLHPAVFSEIYYQRYVNNIYFDSVNLSNYFDNVEGSKNRIKVRIRWYGDLFGFVEKPVLELKIKIGLLCNKKSIPLASFTIDENFRIDMILDLFKRSRIPIDLKLNLSSLQPILLNRYSRKYFLSGDKNCRLTIDSDMEYFKISNYNNNFLHKIVDDFNTVVELKYDPEMDQNVHRITNYFLFRLTKSSKYVNGIDHLYL